MKISIIYVVYTLLYITFVGIVNREIGIEQTLEYILESGNDSELSN